MTTTPTVSVAMATCEGEAFVGEQLASLADQTIQPTELIVCDDASKDGTVAIARDFATRAPFPVHVDCSPTRLGTTKNFERAVSKTTCDVIFLADQDDIWLRTKIEKMLSALDAQPGAGGVLCNGKVVDAERRSLGYDLWNALDFTASEAAAVRAGRAPEIFARHVVAAGTTFAFRAEWKPLVVPFPDLRSAHDAWIAFLIAAVSEIALVPEPLIEYRLHASNQIGMRLFDLRGQFGQARRQIADDAFGYATRFFTEARERLSGDEAFGGALSEQTRSLLTDKIEHSRIREEMRPEFFSRLPVILSELLNGRYRRFSYGLKSVAQDLFLRS